MYLYNIEENEDRINYYGGTIYTPHAFIDGHIDGEWDYTVWDSLITSEEAVSSPIQINLNIDHDNTTNSGTVEAVISATETISYVGLMLRIAITESHIPDFPWSPEFDEHNRCMRDMLPDALGSGVSISEGDVVRITEPYTLDLATEVWDNLEITAFVQADGSYYKDVLQAANQALPGVHVSLSPSGSTVQVPRGGTLSFEAFLSNNTSNNISGDFWLTIKLPSGAELVIPENFLSGSNPFSGSLAGWSSPTLSYDLYIPGSGVPTGIYSLIGHIGRYPDTEIETSFFDFEITP
jgi:hypothetical protein